MMPYMDKEQQKDNGNSANNKEAPLFPLKIYEVIRVINGVPVFIEDHIERLFQSANLAGIEFSPASALTDEILTDFIKRNNLTACNIRISFYFESSKDEPVQKTEIIPHTYPTEEQYKSGIMVSSMQAERTLPNAKIQQTAIRMRADKIIAEQGVWDVVLLDKHGFITEGSRTNIFFVKGNNIITPPPEKVLQGTTRKRVIRLCRENNINVSEEPVKYTDLPGFDSAFLTGTSPKVLPVKSIDNQIFSADNSVTRRISYLYDKEIEQYILLNAGLS